MSRWVLELNFYYEYLALYFMHSDSQGLLITVACVYSPYCVDVAGAQMATAELCDSVDS